ncbi:MAG: DUF4328 domain-containing protein [Streptosporangiaceae bacterium]
MPCGLCGDIIPTEVARCPACGAWSRRRDFRALGIGVFMLLGFNAFMAMGSAVSLMRQLPLLSDLNPDSYDPVQTGVSLQAYSDVFVISGALAGITGLLFVTWLWRAHAQAPGPIRYGRGWTVGGWLVPLANLWVPPRLVHDIWISSGRYQMAQRHGVGLVIIAWWTALLSSIGLARMFPAAETGTIADARFAVHLGVAASATQALAAALCMGAVFQITRLQIRQS